MNAESTPSQEPTHSELLAAIDFELARVREEHARPGWTHWAALSGLAACLWMMFGEAEHGSVLLTATWLLVIAGRLVCETTSMLARLVPSPIPDRAGGRFIPGATMLGSSRELLLVDLLLTIGGAVLVLASGDAVRGLTRTGGLAVFAFGALAVAILLVLSFMRIPLPLTGHRMLHDKRTAWWLRVIAASGFGVLTAFGVFAALGYWQAANAAPHTATLHDWRLAGLILVASLLARLVPAVRSASPLVPTLEHLRRDIALRRIDAIDAVRRFDTVVLGLGISELLQPDVVAILDSATHSKTHVADALTAFHRAFGLNAEGQPDTTIPRPVQPTESLDESLRQLECSQAENTRTIQLIEKLNRRTIFYNVLGVEENDLRALLDRLTADHGALAAARTKTMALLAAKAKFVVSHVRGQAPVAEPAIATDPANTGA